MKLKDLYESIVEIGIKNDPRGEKEVREILKREEEKYKKLTEKEKKFYDIEKLKNPYNDTRILYGDKDVNVNSIIVGIDMEAPEVLLAKILSQEGKKIDLILSHHPEGIGYRNFYEVMGMQADILNKFGVPINIAEG
ncbi:MAG: NGG1p interacting factor NIF3, partial [Elusimicrobiota bacterium]|nr:NGG1p interacting factor NIF3 [Endomicrobiia bacterium]MDW8166777.1 NGG1p interacting factor NIF3 [Elusimicrobiota bacterium]